MEHDTVLCCLCIGTCPNHVCHSFGQHTQFYIFPCTEIIVSCSQGLIWILDPIDNQLIACILLKLPQNQKISHDWDLISDPKIACFAMHMLYSRICDYWGCRLRSYRILNWISAYSLRSTAVKDTVVPFFKGVLYPYRVTHQKMCKLANGIEKPKTYALHIEHQST